MVSVIMPVYNVEAYIRKSIESVLKQTYGDFELLIINDGSPDNSIKIAKEYEQQDSRIKIIDKVNGGLSDARNVGMQYAKGKYIYFLDSDDYIEANLLEVVVNHAETYNSEVVLFGYYIDYVNSNDNLKSRRTVSVKNGQYTAASAKNIPLTQDLLPILGYAWNKLYKKDFIDINKALFVKGVSLIEDILFNEIILSKAMSIVIIDKPLYHYIQRERTTLASTFYKNSYELQLKSTKARENILKAWGGNGDRIQEIIAYQHVQSIRFCCANMFYYKNGMSFKSKYKYIKSMLEDDITKERICFYSANTITDVIIKNIIRHKVSLILTLIYIINSRKHLRNNRSIT